MPRRSAAALTTVTSLETPRLIPPADMAEDAKQVFIDTVLACAPEHFQVADALLLRRYSEAQAWATRAAAEGDAKVFVAMTRTVSALALRLRLSPQARQPRMPKRPAQPVSYYERMAMERDR
jgi:hypothetical protein